MVGTKADKSTHDFEKDPILPIITKDDAGKAIVTATGTTLGADDGLGLAACLAVVFDKSLKTGKIEVLCTKDEETTMWGVNHMSNDFIHGAYLLNLDSEDVGIITIGSAGGFCGDIEIPNHTATVCDKDVLKYSITINGLEGGHSGV